MRSFRSFAALPKNAFAEPTAVAIGKFDGVHSGHREIIRQLTEVAAARGLEACVFTFTENPLATLAPEKCPTPLVSVEQKLELLAAAGVSATLMVDFTWELAELSASEFAERVLAAAMQARVVFVGHDFRFGHRGAGDVDTLKELGDRLGFEVVVVPDITLNGERVSSTRIRELLQDGNVTAAAELLGRHPEIRGLVVHGAARGRDLGFPTANLEPAYEGLAPADGVYAGVARVAGVEYAAAVSIGGNPTFTPDAPSQVEVHLLDFNGSIYGELLRLQFVRRLRGMTAYTGLNDLISQMATDVEQTRDIVG